MGELRIEAKQVGDGIAHVKAIGTLDAATYEKMDKTIKNLFSKGYYKLIVNLEQVSYISSAGAGVFIGVVGTAQENNGHILLLRPSTMVHDVFDVLGLLEIFPAAQSLEEATSFFKNSSL